MRIENLDIITKKYNTTGLMNDRIACFFKQFDDLFTAANETVTRFPWIQAPPEDSALIEATAQIIALLPSSITLSFPDDDYEESIILDVTEFSVIEFLVRGEYTEKAVVSNLVIPSISVYWPASVIYSQVLSAVDSVTADVLSVLQGMSIATEYRIHPFSLREDDLIAAGVTEYDNKYEMVVVAFDMLGMLYDVFDDDTLLAYCYNTNVNASSIRIYIEWLKYRIPSAGSYDTSKLLYKGAT